MSLETTLPSGYAQRAYGIYSGHYNAAKLVLERRVGNGQLAAWMPALATAERPSPPHGAIKRRLPVLNVTVDHCLVGSSGLYYLLSAQYMVRVQFDWFHELWNMKNGAKHTEGGRMWKSILEFMVVANYNHGPFRSGAWHTAKKDGLDLYVRSSSWRSAEFQAAAPELARHWGMPLESDEDHAALFARLVDSE